MRFICALSATFAVSACGDDTGGGIDTPCENDEQCQQGLVCDAHDPPTCQEPHEHPGTGGAGAAGGEAGAGGGMPTAGGGGEGGAGASACEVYCSCMLDTCADIDGYPYANEAACATVCAGFSSAELDCFGAFCVQASEAAAGLDHLCEHAWGAEGMDEC